MNKLKEKEKAILYQLAYNRHQKIYSKINRQDTITESILEYC